MDVERNDVLLSDESERGWLEYGVERLFLPGELGGEDSRCDSIDEKSLVRFCGRSCQSISL